MSWFSEQLSQKTTSEAIDIANSLSAIGSSVSTSRSETNIQLPLAPRLDLSDYENLNKLLSKGKTSKARLAQGNLWQTYVFWHAKGDERTPFLKRSIEYYEKAVELTTLDDKEGIESHLKLARILIEYPAVRDLQRGISIMDKVYEKRKEYTPAYAAYLQALILNKQHHRVIELAEEISANSPNGTAPAVHKIKVKALRSIIRECRKKGEQKAAFMASCEIIKSTYSTENDKKIHEKILSTMNSLQPIAGQ